MTLMEKATRTGIESTKLPSTERGPLKQNLQLADCGEKHIQDSEIREAGKSVKWARDE